MTSPTDPALPTSQPTPTAPPAPPAAPAAAAGIPAVAGRHRRWVPMLVAAAVLGAAGLAVNWWRGPQVPVVTVGRGDLVRTVVASGRVLAPYRVEVGSSVTGTVVDVPVAEGQRVKAGQLLVELESTEARAQVRVAELAVEQAQARIRQLQQVQRPVAEQALAQARATLDNARSQYNRNKDLNSRGFIGQAQLDDARKSLELAQAQWQSAQKQAENEAPGGGDSALARLALESAQAGLDAARARLAYTRIAATADGVLISRSVERGDIVQPGRTLLVLSPDGDTEIVVQIDERNLSLLALGQRALAAADAFPDRRFGAVLSYVNPAVDPQRGSVMVKLRVPQVPDFLRQDMTVSVDIEVARRLAVLTLPLDAVQWSPDGRGATVLLLQDGRVQRRPVEPGLRGGGLVEIKAGLDEGQQVLAGGTLLADGRRARPRQAGAAVAN